MILIAISFPLPSSPSILSTSLQQPTIKPFTNSTDTTDEADLYMCSILTCRQHLAKTHNRSLSSFVFVEFATLTLLVLFIFRHITNIHVRMLGTFFPLHFLSVFLSFERESLSTSRSNTVRIQIDLIDARVVFVHVSKRALMHITTFQSIL